MATPCPDRGPPLPRRSANAQWSRLYQYILHRFVLPGATSVSAYFPKARWFDFYNGQEMTSTGQTQELSTPLDHIQVTIGNFIRIIVDLQPTRIYRHIRNVPHPPIALTKEVFCCSQAKIEEASCKARTQYTLRHQVSMRGQSRSVAISAES